MTQQELETERLVPCKTCGVIRPENAYKIRIQRGCINRIWHCAVCLREKKRIAKLRYFHKHRAIVNAYQKVQRIARNKDPQRKAHHAAMQHAYRVNNKEKLTEYAKQWRGLNKKRVKQYSDEYRKKRPLEYFRQLSRDSYARCKASINAKHRVLRRDGYYRWITLIRRARLKGAGGTTNRKLLKAKLSYYGSQCYYCKTSLTKSNISYDHAIPVARGGTNWTANLLPACRKCNSRKHTMTVFEFLAQR